MVADEKSPTEIETHTILLWKSSPNEITIIDPTDRNFSKFLVDILSAVFTEMNFQMEDSNVNGINGKIYKPKHSDQKLLEHARDCTDIAVKMAFELNEKQTNLDIECIDDILAHSIEQISNTSLPKAIGLFKALQSSDVEIRKKAKELVDTKNLVLEALDITKITTLEEIQEVSVLIGELNTEDISM